MAKERSDIDDEVNDTLDAVEEGREEENAAEEEDDVDEEEEEEEEEEEYTFRFENGISPLDFVDNNDCGVQRYQQFERLEYEALADKKRKALELQQCHREGTPSKKAMEDDFSGASRAEIIEAMELGMRKKRSRKPKKRGRRKGSKKELPTELKQMLGDAALHYSFHRFDKAIAVLHEVVRLAPNLYESYEHLGRVYDSLEDYKRAMDFYMIAAHLSPKESWLWTELFTRSIEQGDIGQASYCLSKAITAHPEDITLRSHRAMLYAELQDYQKAAVAYEHVHQLHRENVDALKAAAKFYKKCGQVECSVRILEGYLKSQPDGVNASVVDLLGAILMETKAHDRALQYIEHAQVVNSGKELPLNLKVKAGICHVHLGNMEMAQVFFNDLNSENASEHVDLLTEVADSFVGLEHYNSALNYYLMLEGNSGNENGILYLKIARCYQFLKERLQAILFFYKALETLQDDVDARITLASLLLEEGNEDEAISLLSPPKDSG